MTIITIITMVLMVAGSLVVFLGAVGLYRMPDVYHRMQASAKASSLGAALLLLAVALHFGEAQVTLRAVAGIVFIFITVPVAAHLLARAAHRIRVPAWSGTLADELVEFQDERRRTREMEISVGIRDMVEDRRSTDAPDESDRSDLPAPRGAIECGRSAGRCWKSGGSICDLRNTVFSHERALQDREKRMLGR